MPNANRDKGARFERAIVSLARAEGLEARRQLDEGSPDDRGDIEIALGPFEKVCVQAKDTKGLCLAEAQSELEVQATRAKARWRVAVHKRRGKSVSESYAVTTLAHYLTLIDELVRIKTENDALWEQTK